MQQIFITGHGGRDKRALREAVDPPPRANELRVRVRASGIHFADIMAREGLYPDAPRLPCVVGDEWQGIADGGVRPHIDRVFRFAPIGAAHAHIQSRQNIGKVVLTP